MIRTILATVVTIALLMLPATAQTSLAGTHWRFVEVAGSGIPVDIGATISFGSDGKVSGHSGCNRFHGGYGGNGAALSFSNMGWTKMLCPGAKMSTETAIQLALARTNVFKIADGTLQLLGADQAILARLETSPPP